MTREEFRDQLVARIEAWNQLTASAPRESFNWLGVQASKELGLPVVDCVLQQLSKLESIPGRNIRREEAENMLRAIRAVAVGEASRRLRLIIKEPVHLPGYQTFPGSVLEFNFAHCDEGGDLKILDLSPPTSNPA
jgi:hypothetical protein